MCATMTKHVAPPSRTRVLNVCCSLTVNAGGLTYASPMEVFRTFVCSCFACHRARRRLVRSSTPRVTKLCTCQRSAATDTRQRVRGGGETRPLHTRKKTHAQLKPSHQQSQGRDRRCPIRLAHTARTQSGGFTAQGRPRRRAPAPSASAPSGRCPRPPTRGPAAWRARKPTARAGVPAPQMPPSGPPRSCTC